MFCFVKGCLTFFSKAKKKKKKKKTFFVIICNFQILNFGPKQLSTITGDNTHLKVQVFAPSLTLPPPYFQDYPMHWNYVISDFLQNYQIFKSHRNTSQLDCFCRMCKSTLRECLRYVEPSYLGFTRNSLLGRHK